jgi:hypothetical protein
MTRAAVLLCAALLLLYGLSCVAGGDVLPTSFSDLIRTTPPEGEALDMSQCTRHEHCPEGNFCRWSWIDSHEGWWFVGGSCTGCSECKCHGDAVDAACPRFACLVVAQFAGRTY